MNRVLRKRLLRDLRSNFMRYFAVILMIVMGMYIIISIVGAAETIITGSTGKAEENCVEDGQFHVFVPLTEDQEEELTDCGIILERAFSMDLEAEDGSILRLMKSRESINRIDLDNGRLAEARGEIVLEKRYCQEHELFLGDNIRLSGVDFEVVGIGSTPDYDMPIRNFSDMAVESSLFGTAFVTPLQYEEIRRGSTVKAEECCYAYRLNDSGIADEDVRQILQRFSSDYSSVDNLMSFVKRADNPRILGGAGDMQMNKKAGLLAGVIVMILFTYIISVFVIHQMQRESSAIGALYALGAKKKELLYHYVSLPAIITFVGGLIGAALGFSKIGIPIQMEDTCNYYSIPELPAIYPVYLIVYSIAMPPLVSVIVNVLVINKRLSQTALSLIRNEQNTDSCRNLNLGKTGFIRRFQFRQMLRERRTGFTVVFGMVISLMVLMLGLNCYILCRNVQKDSIASTKFEYMYTLKYPLEEIPKGGEVCYMKTLSKEKMGYTLDIAVIGIDDDNKYYDVETVKGKNNIVIGKSMQQKYGLQVGDTLVMSDSTEEIEYTFTIQGVADYANGLTVFMNIDNMRELFEKDEDYYNMVLSETALDIEQDRLYALTTREDVEHSASVFTSLMMPMVIMMTAAAVIIFCMVLYLMTGVMIDRASFGISLIRIFGFRIGEVKKLYLNGNMWIVATGALIGIPLAKVIVNALYPWLIANIACGMNLKFPWYLYAGIFAGVMAVYFAVNALLVRKLNRITPAEVLKNRE